ncbi:hypothetical protein BDN72DRAFT_830163 [Pluteus cervinus]|uniref:Uncharacterized protein n=1 Tax=Pluteus cervinus TaxID=181527 RepID=A0ACD3BG31_9AGAR|nr:hypothetical protein BDN72DRAFT_830163 [Pluteus cervinus]
MEESMVPSLSSGVVGSRFITQDEIEDAKARKEEQWKAAYARLGQEPPPRQQEDFSDGRSLAEKLAANKAAKQEEWEEKNKLANQFRALEEDEIMFLDSIRERQETEEKLRKQQEGEEVRNFREAVAARASTANNPPTIGTSSKSTATPATPKVPAAPKKDLKKSLKGVVVKRKPKAPAPQPSQQEKAEGPVKVKGKATETRSEAREEPDEPDAKRRRTI